MDDVQIDTLLKRLRAIVGDAHVLTSAGDLEPYVTEWRGLWRGETLAAVRPADTEQVAAVCRLCFETNTPIFPQGGNTGLVGGGVPHGGIVLSTRRLNRVRDVDTVNDTMTVEAGCILADIQTKADDLGKLFPLSLAAEGSCSIGGNLSTNAGGVQVLRYGNARDLVMGLEVVLAGGRVWDGLRGLRKDNTGYDMKHLFMGAEGTLGVITAAVLKLYPKPETRTTAMAAGADVNAMQGLFTRLKAKAQDALTTFEFANRSSFQTSIDHMEYCSDPFQGRHGCYALMELSGDGGAFMPVLEAALEDGLIEDAVIAESETQAQALWRIRESIPEAQGFEGASIKHDVSVPVSSLPDFIARATGEVEAAMPGVRVMAFGHMGDGNVHYNLTQPKNMDKAAFLARWDEMNERVHKIAVDMRGSFSAEHGVGELKVHALEAFKSPVEIEMMRSIKSALDPANIMNPGKVVPESENIQ